MANDFRTQDRTLFSDCWRCWWCGKNRADSIHHIVGRGEHDGEDTESSPLNAAPMCNQSCHLPLHGELRTDTNVRMLLNKTYDYLIEIGYQLNERDSLFLEKYSSKY